MASFIPSHPGELLRESIDWIREEAGSKMTLEEVAEGLGTTRKTLSAILNERQAVTPEMAVRLAAAFRNTDAEYWLTLQLNHDLAKAKSSVSVENVRVLWNPPPA